MNVYANNTQDGEGIEHTLPRIAKVNVSNFWTKAANPVSISWLVPSDFKGPRIEQIYPAGECIVPPAWLVQAAKSKENPISWETYTKEFARHFWLTAREMGVAEGHTSVTPVLQHILEQVAYRLDAAEITLCCWEGVNNPHCHRKLVYDKLPPYMKGLRA